MWPISIYKLSHPISPHPISSHPISPPSHLTPSHPSHPIHIFFSFHLFSHNDSMPSSQVSKVIDSLEKGRIRALDAYYEPDVSKFESWYQLRNTDPQSIRHYAF